MTNNFIFHSFYSSLRYSFPLCLLDVVIVDVWFMALLCHRFALVSERHIQELLLLLSFRQFGSDLYRLEIDITCEK